MLRTTALARGLVALSLLIGLLAIIASCSRQMASASNSVMQSTVNVQQATGNVGQIPMGILLTPAPTPEKVKQINTDPAKLAVAFYEYYVESFPRIDDERVVFARFITPRFFDEALKAEDYDPFLDAQDLDRTWRNNVSASHKVMTGNRATVKVSLKGQTFKWVLKVSLLKRGGTWKIDGVKNLN
jgi:hypothetical protein